MSVTTDDYIQILLQDPDAAPSYKGYRPLDQARKEIRLLRLSVHAGILHAHIVHVSLLDEPEYQALSYCWGPPTRQAEIVVDDESATIRTTLHSFLMTLVATEQVNLPIWVDSISINQHDTNERNSQVMMMADIYRNATCVKAWIGQADEDIIYAFTFMNHADSVDYHRHASGVHKTFRQCLESIMRRPYWTRIWILQEIALAKKLHILSGRLRVEWQALYQCHHTLRVTKSIEGAESGKEINLSQHVVEEGDNDDDDEGGDDDRVYSNRTVKLHIIDDLEGLRRGMTDRHTSMNASESVKRDGTRWAKFAPDSIIEQAWRYKLRGCQNPRDKIYGLCSLACDGHRVPVDYSRSVGHTISSLICTCTRLSSDGVSQVMDIFTEQGALNNAMLKIRDIVKSMDIPIARFYNELCGDDQSTTFHEEIRAERYRDWMLSNTCEALCAISDQHAYPRQAESDFRIPFSMRPLVRVQLHLYMYRNMNNAWAIGANVCNDDDRKSCIYKLLSTGEIQLCRQASSVTDSGQYMLFLHYSKAAIMILVLRDLYETQADNAELFALLQSYRVRHPVVPLCHCTFDKRITVESVLYHVLEQTNPGVPVIQIEHFS